jgi:hypothetical protein
MSHTSSGAAAITIKHNLHAAILAAVGDTPDVDISFGLRWPAVAEDSISVTSVRSTPEDPNVASTLRARRDVIEVGVVFESWRPGWDFAAEVASSDRAYELLAIVDRYLRDGDHITLGGAALWCLLGPHTSDGVSTEDENGDSRGRITAIDATFIAVADIRNSH